MARLDQLVDGLVDEVHALLARRPRLPRKLAELLPEDLERGEGER